VESAPESVEPLGGTAVDPGLDGVSPDAPEFTEAGRPTSAHRRLEARLRLLSAAWERARFVILVYLGSRALLLAVAIINGALRHHSLLNELANWDGMWYRSIANLQGAHGWYPAHVSHLQTNLGFFPLYPLLVWLVSQPVQWVTSHSAIYAVTVSGVLVSGVGGLLAAILVQKLAAGWWGEQAGRRSAALFCLFPGSVVFSMVYAEGLMLPLAAGCILALQRRRWLLAGILAALATATEPEAVILVLVCAVSAGVELRRRGWGDPPARRSLLAPLLAPLGLLAVGAFFWAWTGTPFANWIAQHDGWKERTDPLSLVHLTTRLAGEVSFSHFNHPTINLNLVIGLLGAAFLVVMLVLLARAWRTVSIEALTWTLGISFIAVTAEYTPPNPRLLITAFPAVIVPAYFLKRRGISVLLVANAVLLVGLSALTFVGVTLRP
jgi:Mannosyltransferase (PIG-V)